jgi:hypothetical protein
MEITENEKHKVLCWLRRYNNPEAIGLALTKFRDADKICEAIRELKSEGRLEDLIGTFVQTYNALVLDDAMERGKQAQLRKASGQGSIF